MLNMIVRTAFTPKHTLFKQLSLCCSVLLCPPEVEEYLSAVSCGIPAH